MASEFAQLEADGTFALIIPRLLPEGFSIVPTFFKMGVSSSIQIRVNLLRETRREGQQWGVGENVGNYDCAYLTD